MVKRVYVEKKDGLDVKAGQALEELRDVLRIDGLEGLRILNRYDVEGADDALFAQAVDSVFSEPAVDDVFLTMEDASIDSGDPGVFAIEYLPGQFDQRADSASECIQLITQGERPEVRSATVYALSGELDDASIERIKDYLVNPVESRIASLEIPLTLTQDYELPDKVEVIEGFRDMDAAQLQGFLKGRGLAMDLADLEFCQDHFIRERRDPTITEIKLIDTYWSDHCRHTTFGTELTDVRIDDADIQDAYDHYLGIRDALGRSDRPVTLMDMGTIGAKALKEAGELTGLDESEEINACTVRVKVDVRGEEQDWLYLFKNETHNHPTEIEPFGGAATCVGGAIRDPLSGRAYVYQAMRVTGAADPTVPIDETIPGKLPQRKIVTTAAEGYSSYGNQIGLATGQVDEVYHPGYAAKRMEIGAVIGATPAEDVRRETPAPGDVIILLGGRTGRDGIGGATGSSKAHDSESIETSGAEVQKGNAPVERKIQRLFRDSEATRMIKRCNDFGAGGVSVAIGELADGLDIYLDEVPLKYEGLDGTEIAISESQERMAVALAPEDADRFMELARAENLEATKVAVVSEEPRVRIHWRGDVIVDIPRDFLASNGAPKQASAHIADLPGIDEVESLPQRVMRNEGLDPAVISLEELLRSIVADLNLSSKKGLVERFDSTIGAATVLMPFGGTNQLTPAQAMVSKFPVLGGDTTTVSGLAWGFDPYISEQNPYLGAYVAVLDSIAKLIATGFERSRMYLTFQEYFEKLGDDPDRWGKPVSALLGALSAQIAFGVGAIGGKDSMSGSFEDLDVPPTLVSFATATGSIGRIVSPEFKDASDEVLLITPASSTPSDIAICMDLVERLIGEGCVKACAAVGSSGIAGALFLMSVGNRIGMEISDSMSVDDLTLLDFGAFVIEIAEGYDAQRIEEIAEAVASQGNSASDIVSDEAVRVRVIGKTIDGFEFLHKGEKVELSEVQEDWEAALEDVFPYRTHIPADRDERIHAVTYEGGERHFYHGPKIARPKVLIPVFPGTNCEYDTLAAFEAAGAEVKVQVINNLTPDAVKDSTDLLADNISKSQIVMLPGGFSGGDEPDGSAKFIASFFRSPKVTEAVRELLNNRDGLMMGICNGFQALVKLGLLPYGDIMDPKDCKATLTFNTIGRHQSRLVDTRISSDLSPWMAECRVGEIYTVAISHGEGRFMAPEGLVFEMVQNGQIATQYVDPSGIPSQDLKVNPNGSMLAIEGITSPDGRILGKMGHSERRGEGLYKNVPGNKFQPIFEAGVRYFQ